MTRDDIAAVMKQIPYLNEFGVGLFNGGLGLTPDERAQQLETDKQALLRSAESCTKICIWLSELRPAKHFRRSSYGLKHLAEPEIGYVTNGAFIVAAVHCGFPYRVKSGSPNVDIGISEMSLRRKRESLAAKR